ncbi:MAG: type II toxin-antitoxin system VapC family toxin [Nocardioidaceae bacterium]
MATRVADRAVLDTNVLLAASDTGRAAYPRARAVLDEWPRQGTTLYASGQILREYLSVATRPVEHNGLGLAQADAVANVRALSDRVHLLVENDKVHARLLALLEETDCGGKQVHDANIAATMLTHGITALATLNTDDFTRFEYLITVVEP